MAKKKAKSVAKEGFITFKIKGTDKTKTLSFEHALLVLRKATKPHIWEDIEGKYEFKNNELSLKE